MTRITFSLPTDLTQQMARVGSSVNWSAVVGQAIIEALSSTTKPNWSELSVQLWHNGSAGTVGPLDQFISDTSTSLGGLVTACKEARHDDTASADFYTEVRTAASAVIELLDNLQAVANKHKA